jgi:NADH-quinone oxidoreductase subunit D
MPETTVQQTEETGERRTLLLNVGPQHPSTHGVLRLLVELDGEVVQNVTPILGYLHSGFEKLAEHKTYHQYIPFTDRLDYMAGSYNNFSYCMAVEKLMDLKVPLRGQYIRVLMGELTRIFSHLLWLGTHAIDLGAMTPVFYMVGREREEIMNLFEMVSGGRLFQTYFRVGGLAEELPEGFLDKVREFTTTFPDRIDEYESLLTKNPIWMRRGIGVGVISREEAIGLGLSGPMARASGVDWDLRKAHPYSSYDHFDFDVPVQQNGDVYSRYLVRIEEMRQANHILTQVLDRMPDGPINTHDPKVVLPPKQKTLTQIESLIHHFLLIEEGFHPPKGEVYVSTESPHGELGFYIISDGGPKPYRLKIRPPCFVNLQALASMARGRLIADLVAILTSIDIVLAEIDR